MSSHDRAPDSSLSLFWNGTQSLRMQPDGMIHALSLGRGKGCRTAVSTAEGQCMGEMKPAAGCAMRNAH